MGGNTGGWGALQYEDVYQKWRLKCLIAMAENVMHNSKY
jgi:hypothetical protein